MTGKYRKGETGRANMFDGGIPFQGEMKTEAILDELFSIDSEIGSAPELVALAWLREKGVIPVLGVRTFEQLENNLKVIDVKLTGKQVEQLSEAGAVTLGYCENFSFKFWWICYFYKLSALNLMSHRCRPKYHSNLKPNSYAGKQK